MESSSRMRYCLRRNYRGSDHFGAAANCVDDVGPNQEQNIVIDPSDAPPLSADVISLDIMNQDDEQETDKLHGRSSNVDHLSDSQRPSYGSADQIPHLSEESTDVQLASDQNLVHSLSAVAPGYVPSLLDERILLELPASMVRLLRVVRGTFQVHSQT